MKENKFSGKEEYVEYEDGSYVLLDEEDCPPLTPDQLKKIQPIKMIDVFPEAVKAFKKKRGRPKAERTKVHIGMRLDPDIVEWLKSQKGYNSLANSILRNEMNRTKD